MDNTQALLIRACKSTNPEERLHKLYRKFYYSGGTQEQEKEALSYILTTIVEVHCPMSLSSLVQEMSHNMDFMYDKTLSRQGRVAAIMQQQIRRSKASDFVGLPLPVKFRSKV